MPDKLKIQRFFTDPKKNVVDLFTWEKRDSVVYTSTGDILFELRGVRIPTSWDQTSFDILVSKYFRKAGVPQIDDDGNPLLDDSGNIILGPERFAEQWAKRLAGAWAHWGVKAGYFDQASGDIFFDEMVYILLAQIASPNSPQHFNTGLWESYAIMAEPEGNWYYDPDKEDVVLSSHRFERSGANACFIQSVEDKLVGDDSIFDLWEREARLFKSGSGTGTNFSNIRGKGEKLSGGGTSSGVMSFLRVGDRSAGTIQSGGTTRRAAKMVILDADHPEIEDFIWSKVIEENKVKALVAGGFDPNWTAEGGAYDSVSFQNANHSVRIPRGFLQAVDADEDWNLTERTTGKVTKTVKARDLWNKIAEAAHLCADPGLQFDDIINDWNTAANDAPLRATNPCSEYTHIEDTACNLASLNLVKFMDNNTGAFNAEAMIYVARLYTIMLEITVTMSHYPSAKLAKNSYEHRTLGLGYANLGALLMRNGLPYDSDAGRAVAGSLTSLLTSVAYTTSAEMANVVGACKAYTRNKEHVSRVITNHARAAFSNGGDLGRFEGLTVTPKEINYKDLAGTGFENLEDIVKTHAKHSLRGLKKNGYRNMQVSVLAPTGTIGLQMGCDTTGIEPDFALVKFKKLAGGGYIKIVNNSVEPALKKLNYTQDAIEKILLYIVGTGTLNTQTAVINHNSLLEKGLDEDTLRRFESNVPRSSSLVSLFSAPILGGSTLAKFGIDEAAIASPNFNFLKAIGFSDLDIKVSSDQICGHQTVEGCANLATKDLAIFDTASICGDGKRVISWEGHIKMLGAISPFLSGAASKTINLPESATVLDVAQAHRMAYDMAVKCVAIYRDNSKLSQVLSASSTTVEEKDPEFVTIDDIPENVSPTEFYHTTNPPKFKLPSQRFGPTWKFTIASTEIFLHAGEYPDGTLGELFIDISKEGSTLKGILSCFAIAVSQGLQHGLPLAKLVDAFTFQTFEPRGLISGSENLKMANSIIDAIFRQLAYYYLGRDDLVQVTTPGGVRRGYQQPSKPREIAVDVAAPNPNTVLTAGGSGNICETCGGSMVQSGTCYRCSNCGNTTGCS